jgi:manganese/zinc/iron transport system ATP- binding protein
MKYAISVKNLSVFYGNKQILSDISVDIPVGVICVIIGPNGAGKTTFIKALLGLVDNAIGSIQLLGQSGTEALRSVAYVPQRRTVDWDFPISVIDVVLMGCYQALGWFRRPSQQDRQRAFQALRHVNMVEHAERPISQLSGGERQRVFLARALLQDAQLYIMDEPFVGVDAITESTIVNVLKELRMQGKTIIVVHHDLQTMQEYFDWVIMLNRQLIAAGPLNEVFTKKNIERTYGALPTFLTLREG